MKIALVCPYDLDRPGGVRSHILGLGEALQERGHLVEVIGPNPDGRVGTLPLVGCGRRRTVAFGGTQIDLSWAPWRRVAAVARRGYDVMHFHTVWNPLVPLQLAAVFGGPKIATFHDAVSGDTPGWARRLMPLGSTAIQRLWLRRAIAVSATAGAHLRSGTYTIIPNGLMLPRDLPPEGDRHGLLFVGRLEPRKGLASLLRAVARLGEGAPPLWVAGDGYLRAQLERQAQGLNVTFLGEVAEREKWSLLRRARLLVAPSLGGESFGIVLTEAMACGTPPLAADNPGYREVLRDRAEQLIFPADDDAALAKRLRALLGDPEVWNELQAWGLQRWRQYDWRLLAHRVEQEYLRCVPSPVRAQPSR